MYPILSRYGSFFLYSYTVVLAIGILFSIGLTAQQAQRRQQTGWADAALAFFITALIGGRITFVWANTPYFAERPLLAWQLWQGGLSYHGVVVAGLLGVWGWCYWQKRPLLTYLNLLTPALILMVAFGWLACWLEGCGYGREAILNPPWHWFTADLPDNFGVRALRYQTQWLGVAWATLTLAITRHRPDPHPFWFALFMLSLGHALITLLRGDPILTIGSWRLDTILDTIIGLIALILLKYQQVRTHTLVNPVNPIKE